MTPRTITHCILRNIADVAVIMGDSSISNIALLQPTDLSTDKKWLRLATATGEFTYFVITGLLNSSNLYGNPGVNRQVHIKPFSETFYRFVALLGNVLGKRELYFSCYKSALSFGTLPRSTFHQFYIVSVTHSSFPTIP